VHVWEAMQCNWWGNMLANSYESVSQYPDGWILNILQFLNGFIRKTRVKWIEIIKPWRIKAWTRFSASGKERDISLAKSSNIYKVEKSSSQDHFNVGIECQLHIKNNGMIEHEKMKMLNWNQSVNQNQDSTRTRCLPDLGQKYVAVRK